VCGQLLSGPQLIIPAKSSGAVGGEFNVVRWISINKIPGRYLQFIQIATGKRPVLEEQRIV
jgi:hypothetical protein